MTKEKNIIVEIKLCNGIQFTMSKHLFVLREHKYCF